MASLRRQSTGVKKIALHPRSGRVVRRIEREASPLLLSHFIWRSAVAVAAVAAAGLHRRRSDSPCCPKARSPSLARCRCCRRSWSAPLTERCETAADGGSVAGAFEHASGPTRAAVGVKRRARLHHASPPSG